jgi:hypothetical protein
MILTLLLGLQWSQSGRDVFFSMAPEFWHVLAKSEGRRAKQRAMGRKKLARLLRKLRAMRRSGPRRDQLPLRIGRRTERRWQRFSFLGGTPWISLIEI